MATISVEGYHLSQPDVDWVRRRLKAKAGIDIAPGKHELVKGRVSRRIRALGLDGFASYKRLLDSDRAPEEEREFINALTTNVTSFFREPHHFDRLREMVSRHSGSELRLWSAGCSSGEEPYSIAISLKEALGADLGGKDVKVLATDIDTQVLEQARQGVYPLERTEGVVESRLMLGFQKGMGRALGWARVRPSVARVVSFRQLNLMESWPFKRRFDGIFCRNVLIYFDKEARDALLQRFAEHLLPGGLLFIGHSESVDADHPLLEPMGQTIYRRKGGAR